MKSPVRVSKRSDIIIVSIFFGVVCGLVGKGLISMSQQSTLIEVMNKKDVSEGTSIRNTISQEVE